MTGISFARTRVGPSSPERRALRGLIFDVDGTLADTERDGHLVAANAAFAALGVPIRWSWGEYRRLLRIPGTENRMRVALRELGTMDPEAVTATAAELFRIKQERYLELVPRLPLRPGVERLIRECRDRRIRLAIVSTSSEPQIHALLESRLPEFAGLFDPVLGQQSGRKVGVEGRLYDVCVELMGFPRVTLLAVEDAEDGFRAARRAGIECVVVPNDYTRGGDFRGAVTVVSSLEDVDLDGLDALARGSARRCSVPADLAVRPSGGF